MEVNLLMENGKALICELDGCEEPAYKKVRTQTGGRTVAREDNLTGKIIQTAEITYSEHWYCKFHAHLIESGH